MRRLMVTMVAALLLAAPLGAIENDPSRVHRERHPGASVAAALLNVVYLPLRIVTTLIGGGLAGITGFLTAGDEPAANDVFDIFNGSQVITPRMLEGKEDFHWSGYH